MRNGFVTAGVAISGLLLMTATALAVESPRLLPVDAQVAGMSYKQWDADWVRMAAVTPTRSRTSLFVSRGGRRCGVQVGDVRLLPASIRPGSPITVRCVVRSRTSLVFPVTGTIAGGETPRRVREVQRAFRVITRAELLINGQAPDQPGRIVTTPTYRVVLPSPNGLDVPPGPEWLRSRDYFAILSPLPRGKHVITTLGIVDPPGDAPEFPLGMRYELTAR